MWGVGGVSSLRLGVKGGFLQDAKDVGGLSRSHDGSLWLYDLRLLVFYLEEGIFALVNKVM